MTAAAWAITVTDAPDKEARAVIENGLAWLRVGRLEREDGRM
jgi:hypothetical protein